MKRIVVLFVVVLLGCGEAVWDGFDADDDGVDSAEGVEGDVADPPDDAVVDGEEPDDVVADDAVAPDDGDPDDAVEPDDGVVDDAVEDDGTPDDVADVPDDAAPDVHPPACEGWYDEVYRLCWQNILPLLEDAVTYAEAVVYCRDLPLGGHPAGTWRVPSINQFRMLVRGCMATFPGGECQLTDECRTETCWTSSPCTCSPMGGPGPSGMYLPSSFSFAGTVYTTQSNYWTSGAYSGDRQWRWNPGYGGFSTQLASERIGALCVRPM